jgi:hypothetical protein
MEVAAFQCDERKKGLRAQSWGTNITTQTVGCASGALPPKLDCRQVLSEQSRTRGLPGSNRDSRRRGCDPGLLGAGLYCSCERKPLLSHPERRALSVVESRWRAGAGLLSPSRNRAYLKTVSKYSHHCIPLPVRFACSRRDSASMRTISTRTKYGLRAMYCLARHYGEGPLLVQTSSLTLSIQARRTNDHMSDY